jgi:hypothetical protein
MLMSFKHNFIFMKTRKTAGTSVEMALQPFCVPDPEKEVQERTKAIVSEVGIVGCRKLSSRKGGGDLSKRWFNHMAAEKVVAEFSENPFDRMQVIATVRNPFTRMVSSFHYDMAKEKRTFANFDETKNAFRDIVLSKSWSNDARIVHFGKRYLPTITIRFENLWPELQAATEQLDLPQQYLKLPHTKDRTAERKGTPVADYFDAETTDVIRKRMAWVFKRFDYDDLPPA